jgi:hypothetical protein
MGQAKRKARKRAVTDIDDSVKEKPAVNGVILTVRQVRARWRSGLRSGSTTEEKYTGRNGHRERRVSSGLRRAVEAVERKWMFLP